MAVMRIVIALICVLFLAGSVQAQADKAGPCGLVTKAEVQEAAGAAVSDGAVNPRNKAVCDFKAGAAGVINITLTPKAAADSADRTVAELKKRGIQAEVVKGFGDSAYASSPGYGMQQLGAYKGSSHVIVTVMLMAAPEAKAKAATQAIMRKALTRVP
jgi:hypothetical protein